MWSMIRVPEGYGEVLGAARALYGPLLRYVDHADFFCGTDPVWAGLHSFVDVDDGRSYRDTAHSLSPHHIDGPASRRVPTVVIPVLRLATLAVVVHELGHVLHSVLDEEPEVEAVSSYGETNHYEAFAEAVTSYLLPGYAQRPCEKFLALMEDLRSR